MRLCGRPDATRVFPPQTQNTVYEIVSEMNTRQDVLEDRLVALEEKLTVLQETLESLPETLSRCLQQHQQQQPPLQQPPQPQQSIDSNSELQRRQQFLHPETSYGMNPVISHSRSVPNTWTSQGSTSSAAGQSCAAGAPSSQQSTPANKSAGVTQACISSSSSKPS